MARRSAGASSQSTPTAPRSAPLHARPHRESRLENNTIRYNFQQSPATPQKPGVQRYSPERPHKRRSVPHDAALPSPIQAEPPIPVVIARPKSPSRPVSPVRDPGGKRPKWVVVLLFGAAILIQGVVLAVCELPKPLRAAVIAELILLLVIVIMQLGFE